MRHFQIRETDKHGCGSFYYFETDESADVFSEAEKFATDKVISRYEQRLSNHEMSFFKLGKRPTLKKAIRVVEMDFKPYKDAEGKDRKNWFAKRKGLKFDLALISMTLKFTNGTEFRAAYKRKDS